MKTHTWVHRLAIAGLVILAVLNASSMYSAPQNHGNPLPFTVAAILGWILFIWGIAIYPRQWGLWLGLFLLGSVLFQIYLRNLAMAHAVSLRVDPDQAITFWPFLASVTLTGVTGMLCLLLRLKPQPPANRIPQADKP